MALTFNMLLRDEGVDPSGVRLLRHETKRFRGRTPYSLWRDDSARLERYQSTQKSERRARFVAQHWASFVVTPDGHTLFVGLYDVLGVGSVPPGYLHDLSDQPLSAEYDLFQLQRSTSLSDYRGRLTIDWGSGTRTWVQHAVRQDKKIAELARERLDPPFPGFTSFIERLSDIEALPPSWLAALASVSGIYLLTCPKTREQYVGSASGVGGLLARWRCYMAGGDGGNVGLKGRDSDYQVSILQVVGAADAAAGDTRLLQQESLWKRKLQSREMGLNRNG